MSQEIQARGWEERSLLGTGWGWTGENSRRWALELSISERSVSCSPGSEDLLESTRVFGHAEA